MCYSVHLSLVTVDAPLLCSMPNATNSNHNNAIQIIIMLSNFSTLFKCFFTSLSLSHYHPAHVYVPFLGFSFSMGSDSAEKARPNTDSVAMFSNAGSYGLASFIGLLLWGLIQ
ncbi:hypothetical protein VNO77_01328 [Canavalia gladiata]|uniref:Uncharacterized protein n=1 Tax=Canavalia gladiata TaxID=3824 RepID=A0AAN9MRP5_CANGL